MRGGVSLRGFVEVLGRWEFALGIKLSLFERSEFDNFIPVFSKITASLVPQNPRTSPHPAHLISSAIPHRTKLKVERKKVQDITLFQPKMRDHRSHRLRALPFFINFIQTNTQGDARDTRTPVPTPKPRGQGGGS